MRLPLAIYTAEHGLEWAYDASAIDYSELDWCRTALGPLPDFDLGGRGYEGVAANDNRVFVIRCFSVPKWDFMGRDATYMAVTWFERNIVSELSLEALLKAVPLNEPQHLPVLHFDHVVEPSCGEGFDALADKLSASSMTLLGYRRIFGEACISMVGGHEEDAFPGIKAGCGCGIGENRRISGERRFSRWLAFSRFVPRLNKTGWMLLAALVTLCAVALVVVDLICQRK